MDEKKLADLVKIMDALIEYNVRGIEFRRKSGDLRKQLFADGQELTLSDLIYVHEELTKIVRSADVCTI
jgi:hypothetical protein